MRNQRQRTGPFRPLSLRSPARPEGAWRSRELVSHQLSSQPRSSHEPSPHASTEQQLESQATRRRADPRSGAAAKAGVAAG